MALARWLTDALSFDTETTGTDVFTDRIVTAHAVDVGRSGASTRGSWLFNPGVPIPASAAAIHGITTEKAQREGTDPRHELPELVSYLASTWSAGRPVIICNASFDLTILAAELRRYGLPPLEVGPVLDPLVIDRAMDPYRKGKRNLSALAQHYNVKQDNAHEAKGDALTAARVVWRQAQRYTHLEDFSLEAMVELQRNAHHDWAAGFEEHLRKQGKTDVINREWPVRALPEVLAA